MPNINYYLKLFGIDFKVYMNSVRGFPDFIRNRKLFKKQIEGSKDFTDISLYPCPADRYDTAGSFPLHYFHQDLLVAQEIFKASPQKHVDIGSRIDGFISHLASFREVEVFDIREINDVISGVKFIQADLMDDNFSYKNYTDSVSSLHALEHFGLGRYGDRIDVNGYLKGLENIYGMLKQGGRFYFSVPIGPQRIEFDAHRVFSVRYLVNILSDRYKIISFSYINDDNKLFTNVELKDPGLSDNFGCNYGCGIFILEKK